MSLPRWIKYQVSGASKIPKSAADSALVDSSLTDDGTTLAVATNKLTVTLANGNTAIAGTLAVTGAITENGVAVLSGAISANTVPKGSGGNLADSLITDNGTTINFGGGKLSDALTTSGTLATLSMTGTGLTADGKVVDVSSSATYDTTGGALSATGHAVLMFGSKSAGAAQFTQAAGLFSASGADTNIALRTNSGVNWLNVTDGQTSIGYTSGSAPTTTKFNVTAASINTGTAGFINSVASSTSSTIGVSCSMSGSMDTTANVRTFTGLKSFVTASRVAGANALTNIAAHFSATTAQTNIALQTDDASVYLATVSGSVGVGYASAAALPKKLSVTGDVYVSTELEVDGALNHDGTTVGFYGKAPVTQAGAITDLTDSTSGTANNTVQALTDLTDSPASADALRDDIVTNLLPALRNNFADLTAKVNAILAAIRGVGLIA